MPRWLSTRSPFMVPRRIHQDWGTWVGWKVYDTLYTKANDAEQGRAKRVRHTGNDGVEHPTLNSLPPCRPPRALQHFTTVTAASCPHCCNPSQTATFIIPVLGGREVATALQRHKAPMEPHQPLRSQLTHRYCSGLRASTDNKYWAETFIKSSTGAWAFSRSVICSAAFQRPILCTGRNSPCMHSHEQYNINHC